MRVGLIKIFKIYSLQSRGEVSTLFEPSATLPCLHTHRTHSTWIRTTASSKPRFHPIFALLSIFSNLNTSNIASTIITFHFFTALSFCWPIPSQLFILVKWHAGYHGEIEEIQLHPLLSVHELINRWTESEKVMSSVTDPNAHLLSRQWFVDEAKFEFHAITVNILW